MAKYDAATDVTPINSATPNDSENTAVEARLRMAAMAIAHLAACSLSLLPGRAISKEVRVVLFVTDTTSCASPLIV